MTQYFDPYHLLLGIAPAIQPPDHYQLLGIERLELSADVISNAAERQCDQLKRHGGGEFGSAIAELESVVLAGRDCLLDREAHRQYAAELQGFVSTSSDATTLASRRDFDNEFDLTWQSAQQLAFDPQYHWLGIPRHQRPASNFRLLGIASEERNPKVIQNAAERQIAFVRKFASGNQADQANELLRQLGRARAALTRDELASAADKTILNRPKERPQQDSQRLRMNGPESVVPPVSGFRIENREETIGGASVGSPSSFSGPTLVRRRKRRRATSKLYSVWTTLVWIVPFVLPTAAIVGYVKWAGDGGGRIFAALDALKSPVDSEIDKELPASSVGKRRPPPKLGAPGQRRFPDQDHAKPSRRDREDFKQDSRDPAIRNEENGDMSAELATPKESDVEEASVENQNLSPRIDLAPLERSLFTTPRTWSTKGGRSFDATVVRLTRDQVTMKSAGNNREAVLPVEKFIDEDQVTLRVLYFDQQDSLQFNKVSELVGLIPSLPKDMADVLSQSIGNYPDSPYASLWKSVVLSESENKYSNARSMLQKVIKRLDQQRETNLERHAMTLASSLNNLAICMIMDHKTNLAAVSLVRSLDLMPIASPIILHNSHFLLQLGTEQQNSLKLSSVTSRKLKAALKDHPITDLSMGQSWYYALDVDLPRFALDSRSNAIRYLSQALGAGSVRSKLAVRHTNCVRCQGRGYYVCKNCHKGTVSVIKQVPIGTDVSGNAIMGPKVFPARCPNCQGRGSFKCRFCTDGRLK